MNKAILSVLLLILSAAIAYGNAPSQDETKRINDSLRQIREGRQVRIDAKISILDVKTPATEVDRLLYLSRFHPATDSIPHAIRAQVAERTRRLAKDSLSSADLLWALRPFLFWLQDVDPHLRVTPQPRLASYTKTSRKQADALPLPGFHLLNINDTLVVERSVDPLFKAGDRIVSINGIPASEYLEYCYSDRSIYSFTLMSNYHFQLVRAADYQVQLERAGQPVQVTTPGLPLSKISLGLTKQQEFRTQIFPEAKAGYFAMTKFYPNNSLLINRLRKAILNAKKQGCTSFILDLRGNPGGNGGWFDELLSIFLDKPTIPYMKSQRLKVSGQTRSDYEFLTDSIPDYSLIEMPEKEIIREVTLDPKKYISGMRYYVLMNKDTGSVAATFCNILQYNDGAKLVGEPLRRNALKYGEVIEAWLYLTNLYLGSLSTMEFDEYTRAVDGVLMPDIAIPYVAADYLSGEDAMLKKLLARLSK